MNTNDAQVQEDGNLLISTFQKRSKAHLSIFHRRCLTIIQTLKIPRDGRVCSVLLSRYAIIAVLRQIKNLYVRNRRYLCSIRPLQRILFAGLFGDGRQGRPDCELCKYFVTAVGRISLSSRCLLLRFG